MRKISRALFLCGLAVALTACGSNANPAGNLAKDITIDAGSLKKEGKSVGRQTDEKEVSDKDNSQQEDGAFCFVYEGASLIPGEPLELSVLPKYTDVAEVPSCAFGGNDNVYNFKLFELTAYFDQDEERIYSIYFTDPNLPTTEGLRLGDTVDDMKSLYGEDYEAEENAYTYTKGETLLNIITKNDMVIGIEYRLDR